MFAFSTSWRFSFQAKLIAAFALIIIGDVLFYQNGWHGAAIGAFALAWLGTTICISPAIRKNQHALAATIAATLFGIALIFDTSFLSWTLFWTAITLAAMLPFMSRFDDGWQWSQRLLMQSIRASGAAFIDLNKLKKVKAHRPRRSGRLNPAHFILPLVGGGIIVGLFAAANPLIEEFLSALRPPSLTVGTVGRIMLWIFLILLIWGSLRPRFFGSTFATFDGSGDIHIPGVNLVSIKLSLILFNILFAVQNGLDAVYLWGGGGLPEGMTLAEYAHRGAYPLIATAILAGLFVLVALRPGSQTASDKTIRTMVILWIGQNIILVASSILRTLDYIEVYSLTILRIAALAWMILIAIGLVLICWRMFKGRSASWLINSNMVTTGLLLTACCFVDLGAVAASWNVRHAKEVGGQGTRLDMCYLDSLGSSSLLSLIALEQQKLEPHFKARVSYVRQLNLRNLAAEQRKGWTMLGAYRLSKAEELLGPDAVRQSKATRFDRSCDGRSNTEEYFDDYSKDSLEDTSKANEQLQPEELLEPPNHPEPKPQRFGKPDALSAEREANGLTDGEER